MTLLVALKGSDGLVLAADSRGTFGDPRSVTAQNDSMQKAHVLARHVAALAAGSGELGSLIVREALGTVAQQNADGVTQLMDILRNTARDRYQAWFPSLPAVGVPLQVPGQAANRLDLVFLVAGYDMDEAGTFSRANVYQLNSGLDFPPMLHDYGFAVAGVPQYALYLLNRLYGPDRSARELAALAIYSITETASQDGKVGGPVRVITIKPDEGCVVLDEAAVAEIVEQNNKRAASLRDSFFGRRGR